MKYLLLVAVLLTGCATPCDQACKQERQYKMTQKIWLDNLWKD